MRWSSASERRATSGDEWFAWRRRGRADEGERSASTEPPPQPEQTPGPVALVSRDRLAWPAPRARTDSPARTAFPARVGGRAETANSSRRPRSGRTSARSVRRDRPDRLDSLVPRALEARPGTQASQARRASEDDRVPSVRKALAGSRGSPELAALLETLAKFSTEPRLDRPGHPAVLAPEDRLDRADTMESLGQEASSDQGALREIVATTACPVCQDLQVHPGRWVLQAPVLTALRQRLRKKWLQLQHLLLPLLYQRW